MRQHSAIRLTPRSVTSERIAKDKRNKKAILDAIKRDKFTDHVAIRERKDECAQR